ncbi:hypothetical protein BY996DRAFT_6565059 [Phakopsora pachyrhizi]|nr:hypothetical protein BY996DRAFT_6565059 [Phakopsora pachyrhizi]
MYEVDRLVGGEVEFWGTKEEEELKSNTGSLGEEDAENYGLQKNKDVKKDKDGKKDKSDHKDEKSCAKKLIKAKNFTQHINTLDADKPIMQRKAAINSGADESTEPILKGLDAVASLNSRDELYKIAKNYRIKRKSVVEGNITLSETMLTSIPENNLGIDTQIKISKLQEGKMDFNQAKSPSNSATEFGQPGAFFR